MKLAPALQAWSLYLSSRAGPVGWAGLAALLLAALLAGAARFELDPANQAAADELAQLQAQLKRASAPGAALRNPTDAMGAVAGQLPAAEQMPAFIQDVQSRAQRGGVQIDRTEYRVQSALGRRALRLQLVMPAHGTYPQLRAWLESLLHEYSSAALDELSLRRQGEGGAQLDAHVVFSFYSQAAR
jgi:Tfp pilus assembly protein PilO